MSNSPDNKRSITEALIGISDGIIIPLAIITGASVLADTNRPVLVTGFSIIFLGGLILGIAGFLSARSRQKSLALQSKEEEEKSKQDELIKTVTLFKKIGLGEDIQQQVASEIEKDSAEWNAYLEKHTQQLEKPDSTQLPKTAISIALAFVIGGLIPLFPYFMNMEKLKSQLFSIIVSTLILGVVGYYKSKVNKEPIIWGTLRLMFLGFFAAVAVFGVAKIFLR